MKKIFSACILAISLSALFFSCSKGSDDNETVQDSDKFVGTYVCITGDFLIITKTDSKTINIEFLDEIGESHSWDILCCFSQWEYPHSYSTVLGTSFKFGISNWKSIR